MIANFQNFITSTCSIFFPNKRVRLSLHFGMSSGIAEAEDEEDRLIRLAALHVVDAEHGEIV